MIIIREAYADEIEVAAKIHSDSWIKSHEPFCSPEFIALHTPDRQLIYLKSELSEGKKLYILFDGGEAKGIVTVIGSLIENLYVSPLFQRMGYGTKLLEYAIEKCEGRPTLWILCNNEIARRMYLRRGFRFTGKTNALSPTVSEEEMIL